MLIGLAYALLWGALAVYIGYARSGRAGIGWAAIGVMLIEWGLLTAGLVQRGLAAGHWPLTTRYEVALWLWWAIAGIGLLLEFSRFRGGGAGHDRQAGGFVAAIALLAATYALFRPAEEQAITPLLPALRSAWLQLHVLTSVVGYGAFGVAAGLGLRQLLLRSVDFNPRLERAMDRAVALGFPWLTLGILTGAVWAQQAWGRYWGWDPKETWALVTWLWYVLVLHVQPLHRWRGRPLAALVVAGFGLVIFTFAGVPWLVQVVRLESLHGF